MLVVPRKFACWTWLIILLACGLVQARDEMAKVAYVTNSGQLMVVSEDGSLRWTVTQPDETLHPVLGYNWHPCWDELFYAVNLNDGTTSLRIGLVDAQTSQEFARVSGTLSGGEWLDSERVVISVNNVINVYNTLAPDENQVLGRGTLISPFTNPHPNLYAPRSVSSAGSGPNDYTVFAWNGSAWQLYGLDGTIIHLPNANLADPEFNGIWSQNASFAQAVAYRGIADDGNYLIGVTHNNTGNTVQLKSENGIPITPLLWWYASTTLYYRDAIGQVRKANLECLESGCTENPLENGIVIAPASADEFITDSIYRDSDQIRAFDFACVLDNNCLETTITMVTHAAPETMLHYDGEMLIYTAYSKNALDPQDRQIQTVDRFCGYDNSCQPETLLQGAVAGLLPSIRSNEKYIVADILGDGLYAVRLTDLNRGYLSGSGTDLLRARWN